MLEIAEAPRYRTQQQGIMDHVPTPRKKHSRAVYGKLMKTKAYQEKKGSTRFGQARWRVQVYVFVGLFA